MAKHFQKTISLPLPELREAEAKQAGLADLILGMFEFTHGTFTPSDVHRSLTNAGYRYRDTSVRARMTELTAAGRLVKLDRVGSGPYGMPEHFWRLADPQDNQTSLFD